MRDRPDAAIDAAIDGDANWAFDSEFESDGSIR
jgi:hypothetical protein